MERFDVVGAGLGPFNLSLAALVEPLSDVRTRFFEARPSFQWHSGLMVPGARLQVSYLKDLVTLVDPSSVFSFLSYLASEGRLYRFLIAHDDRCSRQEFERYYQWAADQLKSVRWDHPVESVRLHDGAFEVTCARAEPVTTTNVVVGSGRAPALPAFACTAARCAWSGRNWPAGTRSWSAPARAAPRWSATSSPASWACPGR
jgi:lysine N6-hydroxylase